MNSKGGTVNHTVSLFFLSKKFLLLQKMIFILKMPDGLERLAA